MGFYPSFPQVLGYPIGRTQLLSFDVLEHETLASFNKSFEQR